VAIATVVASVATVVRAVRAKKLKPAVRSKNHG
jgi:hypothetical protein